MAIDLDALIDKLPALYIPGIHSKESIGIDIGSSSLKILQLKRLPGKFQLVRWSLIPMRGAEGAEISPEEKKAAATSVLKAYRGSGKGIPKNAIASVSGASVIVRYVKFQKLTRAELSKTIKTEAEPHVPFNIEEAYLGFHPIRDVIEQGKQKMETALVAAKKDFVNERISILEGAGFKPVIMDIDSFALETAYEALQEKLPPEETVLIANIGNSKTNFSIIEKGITLVVKDSPLSGSSITKAIVKNLGAGSDAATAEKLKYSLGILSPEEKTAAQAEGKKEVVAVSDAVSNFLRDFSMESKKIVQFYIQQGKDKKVNRMLISGGSANLKNLGSALSKEMNMPVEKFNPFAKIAGAEGVPEEYQPTLAVACGLAMRKRGDTEEK